MAKRIIITKHHEESSESEAEIDIFHRHAHPIKPFVSRLIIRGLYVNYVNKIVQN